MGHKVPYPWPDISHIAANSTFYYPLKITQSSIRINVTVYTGGYSGLLEGAINNEQFVQVQTVQTGNYSIYQAAPIMQFNITQTIVPSIVTFRLRNIQNFYSIHSLDFVSAEMN